MNRVVVAGIGPRPDSEDGPQRDSENGPQRDSEAEALEVLAAGLRSDGSEVIFTGWDQDPARVVTTALQEDADAIGLAGATATVLAEVRARLAEEHAEDIAVFTADA